MITLLPHKIHESSTLTLDLCRKCGFSCSSILLDYPWFTKLITFDKIRSRFAYEATLVVTGAWISFIRNKCLLVNVSHMIHYIKM